MGFKSMSQQEAIVLLRQRKVFESRVACPGKRGVACGAVMKERRRKKRAKVWQCPHSSCRKELSIRFGCSFLSLRTNTMKHYSRMALNEVLEIVYLFVAAPMTIRQAANITHHSLKKITHWWGLCREVCSMTMERQPRYFGTTNQPIQVDESFFSKWRKYGRGRLQ